MPRTIDHANAETRSYEVTAGRATCSCGWRGPLRDTEIDARPDAVRHAADHAAFVAGYRLIGVVGVGLFASHRHAGPPPDGERVDLSTDDPGGYVHRHDGGGRPHIHEP